MNKSKNSSSIQNVKFKLKKKLVCLKYSFQLCATTSPVTYHNVVKVDKKSQPSSGHSENATKYFRTFRVCAFALLHMQAQ
jgi:hypothetical protein